MIAEGEQGRADALEVIEINCFFIRIVADKLIEKARKSAAALPGWWSLARIHRIESLVVSVIDLLQTDAPIDFLGKLVLAEMLVEIAMSAEDSAYRIGEMIEQQAPSRQAKLARDRRAPSVEARHIVLDSAIERILVARKLKPIASDTFAKRILASVNSELESRGEETTSYRTLRRRLQCLIEARDQGHS